MKSNLYLLISLLLLISACDIVYFEAPQPYDTESITVVPTELQGQWVNISNSDSVVLTINRKGYQLNEYAHDTLRQTESYVLSDSVILKKAGKLYVASIKGKEWWHLVIIKKNKDGDIMIYNPNNAYASKIKSLELSEKKKDSFSSTFKYRGKLSSRQIKKLNPRNEKAYLLLSPDSTMSNVSLE